MRNDQMRQRMDNQQSSADGNGKVRINHRDRQRRCRFGSHEGNHRTPVYRQNQSQRNHNEVGDIFGLTLGLDRKAVGERLNTGVSMQLDARRCSQAGKPDK